MSQAGSKNTKPVKIALVGCGAIAERYHLPALLANPATRGGITLVDTNEARVAAMANEHGIASWATDFRSLPAEVDGAIIAAPPFAHHDIAIHFLSHGAHVLCEKPLADSPEECAAMVAAAEAAGRTLSVNQTRRLFPTFGAIRDLIARGELGALRRIEHTEGCDFDWPAASPFHFAPGARGVLSDVGVHVVDLVCWWLNAKPELVESLNDSAGGPEAMAAVRMQHEQCEVRVHLSRLGRMANRFRIEGELGVIEAGHEDWSEVVVRFNDGRRKRVRPSCTAKCYTDFAKPIIENLVSVIRDGATPLIPAASVLPAIELLEDAYEQAEPLPAPWNSQLLPVEPLVRSSDPLRVLVTGASGFVGSRLVEVMATTGAATPVAAIRQWARAARAARRPVDFALCDILDADAVNHAVANVDAVVHCAYDGGADTIVNGTRNLLNAASKAGVQRFVYLSSAEVYGSEATGVVDESTDMPLTGSAYADAKIEAERLCHSAASMGLHPVVLRPSIIYGPGSASWTVNVAKRLLSGGWGRFEDYGDGLANLVHVDDLIEAILLSLSEPMAAGKSFNVNGADRITWNEYFERFNAALGLPPLKSLAPTRSRVRTYVMDRFGQATDLVRDHFEDRLMEIYLRGGRMSQAMKWLKGKLDATPSGAELTGLYSRHAYYDDTLARSVLGYQPRVSLDQGLCESVAWLRQQQLAGAEPPAGEAKPLRPMSLPQEAPA